MRVARISARLLFACGLLLSSSIALSQGTASYTYDDAGRLRSAVSDDGTSTTYTLDAAGNRTNATTVLPAAGFQIAVPPGGYSVPENSGTISIAVRRVGPLTGAASVSTGFANGTATSGSDFNNVTPATLSWPSNEGGQKTFTITILNDSTYEGATETFNAVISSPSGIPLGSPFSVPVTIVEDDAPPPGQLQLSASTYSVAESAGTLTISVTRTGGSGGAASINYTTTAGTATAPADYTTTSGTLNWANGDAATKTFNIPIVNDTIVEGSHTLTVTLSGATGASAGSTLSATVTITEPPPGVLNITPVTTTVNEGTATVGFSVTRTGGSYGNISVNYATANGTATAGSDYTATSGTLSWTNGDTAAKSASVAVINNTVGEPNETFTVTLSGVVGATISTPTSTITIEDNETGSLQFSAAGPITVVEGVGTVTLSVTRTNGQFGSASVLCSTANGDATAGSDYTAVSTTLSWTNGDSAAKNCTISITNDTLLEHSYCWGTPTCTTTEYFFINLSGASGASLSTPNQVVVAIDDDEPLPAPTNLQISPSTISVAENGGSAVVTVVRSGTTSASGPATVTYQASSGSATSGADFTAVSGTLSWSAGDGSPKTFSIPILDDSTYEGNETITAQLGTVTGDVNPVASPANSGTITIVENDPAPAIQITNPFLSVLPAHSSVYKCEMGGGPQGFLFYCELKSTGQDVYNSQPSGTVISPGYTITSDFTLFVTADRYGQP
jgi:YD repeat-containing protein